MLQIYNFPRKSQNMKKTVNLMQRKFFAEFLKKIPNLT